MLQSLELTNFMSVTYAKHTFSPGLNVIRGANEAGKSTRFLAVAYALWGARALPDSLEDTVTWGQPVSSLKVTLTFSVGNTIYTVVRTRAGAALAGSDNSMSEGQAEVTAQIERITGASAGTGMLTLLANQGDLQSSLGSVSLIEKLSNTSLLDQLITAISDAYPSGNTKQLEIELAKELVKPVNSSEIEERLVKDCEAKLALTKSKVADVEARLIVLKPEVALASNLLTLRKDTERKIEDLRSRLKPRLAEPVKPEEPRTLEELQQLKTAAENQERAKKAYDLFCDLPKNCQDGSLAWFNDRLSRATQQYKKLSEDLTALSNKRMETKASGIWEESCALCGKLLTDVPEVVQINDKVKLALLMFDGEIAEVTAELTACAKRIAEFEALIQAANTVKVSWPVLADYCTIDYEFTPPKICWTAAAPTTAYSENFAELIQDLHAKRSWYIKALAEVTAHNSQCLAIEQELASLAIPDTAEAEETLAMFAQLESVYSDEVAAKEKAEQALLTATHALDKAQSIFAAQMEAYNTAVVAKEQLLHLLNEYRENNALIAKLKALKPVVSKTLWSLVLLSVSTVFSRLRGVQSVVARDSDGFLIDGKKARSYSGSTKDILGLAIRITLQKTFLPSLSFCLLDEPAAAADSVREEAILAALSRVDFSQVLLVTHSDLADTFAQSVHLL